MKTLKNPLQRRLFCGALLALSVLPLAAHGQRAMPKLNEETVTLASAGGTLEGSLLMPSATGPLPVVLIIAGSGPTDRNGNSPQLVNNSLRKLAIGLALKGVASVRYDKRGVGASLAAGPREADLRFDAYVDDAAAWLAQLRKDQRFGQVSVVGHSEGALIGMLAAKAAKADLFVSIAGAGRPAGEILRQQLVGVLSPSMEKDSKRILAELEGGRESSAVPPTLGALFRPSVQPYLISYFRHDPVRTVAQLTMPVLIVQGTNDLQVTVADAELLHRARPGSSLVLVSGMNHVLKLVDGDISKQSAAYKDPALAVAPQLVDEVANFILRKGVRK